MKYRIEQSQNLCGKITAQGSKNAALPIMAATMLSGGKCTLKNLPLLSDIDNMRSLMSDLGCEISDELFDFQNLTGCMTPYEKVSSMRGSFLLAGPLLARAGHAKLSLPGGCPIGSRPIDLHLKGFAALGAEISFGHGYVEMSCKKLCGDRIYLDFPSVGATENLIMAACLADGETVIENAAAEPEIVDLCAFLNEIGADVSGAGSDTVRIHGVKDGLHGGTHSIIPDRIEAGTYLLAFAITGGKGIISGINPQDLKPVLAKLSEMGAIITEGENEVSIDAEKELQAVNIKTMPFPGFPTDMQAQFCSLLSTVKGTGIITETVFENRFLHIDELRRMGANIKIDGRTAVIEGVEKLTGAEVVAHDLRGGAALVLAGLAAGGVTEITGIEHLHRGYQDISRKLSSVGAKITLCE